MYIQEIISFPINQKREEELQLQYLLVELLFCINVRITKKGNDLLQDRKRFLIKNYRGKD